jgi:hypothetical protein
MASNEKETTAAMVSPAMKSVKLRIWLSLLSFLRNHPPSRVPEPGSTKEARCIIVGNNNQLYEMHAAFGLPTVEI